MRRIIAHLRDCAWCLRRRQSRCGSTAAAACQTCPHTSSPLRRSSRGALALGFSISGLLLLMHSGMAYLRAEMFRRELLSAPVPVAKGAPSQQPQRDDLIGTLEIPRLGMCDPIVEGDGDRALAHSIGHLPDTPLPWQPGNTAVAAHRDTVFRPLARIRVGDLIAINTERQRYQYMVRETRIVEPDDLSVLQNGPVPSLTLITCYPFRFIGPAPKRFIVHAERVATNSRDRSDCRNGGL